MNVQKLVKKLVIIVSFLSLFSANAQIDGMKKVGTLVDSTPQHAISFYKKKGSRPKRSGRCEDFVAQLVDKEQGLLIAAIFDGHGGSVVSNDLANHFLLYLSNNLKFWVENPKEQLPIMFLEFDRERSLKLSTQFGGTGSTAIVFIQIQSKNEAYLAILGDSQAVVGMMNNDILETEVHNVTNTDEMRRIDDIEGFDHLIFTRGYIYDNRSGYGANLTRAFGDHYLKPLISAKPKIISLDRDQLKFVALLSDGVADMIEGRHLAQQIHHSLKNPLPRNLAKEVFQSIRSKVPQSRFEDDFTLMILPFNSNSTTQESSND